MRHNERAALGRWQVETDADRRDRPHPGIHASEDGWSFALADTLPTLAHRENNDLEGIELIITVFAEDDTLLARQYVRMAARCCVGKSGNRFYGGCKLRTWYALAAPFRLQRTMMAYINAARQPIMRAAQVFQTSLSRQSCCEDSNPDLNLAISEDHLTVQGRAKEPALVTVSKELCRLRRICRLVPNT